MTFNDKIDIFMKNKGYKNLKQLSMACNIPYTTLRDFYEKKSADNSRLSTIRKLSKFMNCTMDYLAYDEITEPNNININNVEKSQIDNSKEIYRDDNYKIKVVMEQGETPYDELPQEEKQKIIFETLSQLAKDDKK